MAKGGLIIDVLSGPPESEDESADESEDAAAVAPPRADPETLLSGIESQLAQLRGLIAGM